jgi:flavin-binding protein dodecin
MYAGTAMAGIGSVRLARQRRAQESIRDLRVAEVVQQDIHLEDGGAITYRTKLQLSFKYEAEK